MRVEFRISMKIPRRDTPLRHERKSISPTHLSIVALPQRTTAAAIYHHKYGREEGTSDFHKVTFPLPFHAVVAARSLPPPDDALSLVLSLSPFCSTRRSTRAWRFEISVKRGKPPSLRWSCSPSSRPIPPLRPFLTNFTIGESTLYKYCSHT